jgi:hypothetical protein
LALDTRLLRAAEIGARRNLSEYREPARLRDKREAEGAAAARTGKRAPADEPKSQRTKRNPIARWDHELRDALRSMRTVLSDDGAAILWLGDAELGGARVAADEQLRRLAPDADMELVATAAQERTDMRGGPPRKEHLLLLHPQRSA